MSETKHYLHDLIEKQTPVYVYLINGIKLQGVIREIDDQAILLTSQTDQLVFKHAVSSIIPLSR